MKRAGIPLSPDRVRFRVQIAAVSVAAVGGFCLLLWIVTGSSRTVIPSDGRTPSEVPADHPLASEQARASAYQALRDYIDHAARRPGVVNVYCRGSRHQIIGQYFEFQGEVDLIYAEGKRERLQYLAVLSGSERTGWEVLSFTLNEPAGALKPSETETAEGKHETEAEAEAEGL